MKLIAKIALFLVFEDASYITGAMFMPVVEY
jgi:hypothetical protein